jgi:hypothetical protein
MQHAALKFVGVITALVLGACSLAQAADASAEVPANRVIYVRSTVSEPARQLLQLAQKAQLWKLQVPAPGDVEGWKKLRAALEAAAEPGVLKAIERNEVTVTSIKLGGVPVLDVFKALLAQGYRMKDIAIYGASAGGGLATSTVLNLRDCGMGMPAAVVLWSPWVDKTIFLSGSARLYQKIGEAGQPAFFDIYEGMIHVFQQFPMPESDVAIRRSVEFMHKRLAGKDRAEQATIDGTSKPPQPVKLD